MEREIVIKPPSGILAIDLRELWQYRELLLVFVWRDIKVRYTRTVLGPIWAILPPLVTTGVFSIFFGKIAKLPSDNLPYPLFVLAGVTFWTFFANGVNNACQSIVANEGIIKKIYFPRVLIPLAAILIAGLDFLVGLIILFAVAYYFGFVPQLVSLILFPLTFIPLFLATAGLGLFTAGLNVFYRDVRFILAYFLQVGLFVTPIVYPISVIYDYRRQILVLNPLTAVVETARRLLTNSSPDWFLLSIGILVSAVVFAIGLTYFRKCESFFADLS